MQAPRIQYQSTWSILLLALWCHNPFLFLQIKYKEEWEKTKFKACEIGVDDLSVKAAKASRDLASDVSKLTLLFAAKTSKQKSKWL